MIDNGITQRKDALVSAVLQQQSLSAVRKARLNGLAGCAISFCILFLLPYKWLTEDCKNSINKVFAICASVTDSHQRESAPRLTQALLQQLYTVHVRDGKNEKKKKRNCHYFTLRRW